MDSSLLDRFNNASARVRGILDHSETLLQELRQRRGKPVDNFALENEIAPSDDDKAPEEQSSSDEQTSSEEETTEEIPEETLEEKVPETEDQVEDDTQDEPESPVVIDTDTDDVVNLVDLCLTTLVLMFFMVIPIIVINNEIEL